MESLMPHPNAINVGWFLALQRYYWRKLLVVFGRKGWDVDCSPDGCSLDGMSCTSSGSSARYMTLKTVCAFGTAWPFTSPLFNGYGPNPASSQQNYTGKIFCWRATWGAILVVAINCSGIAWARPIRRTLKFLLSLYPRQWWIITQWTWQI